jgi:Rrf2 family protein
LAEHYHISFELMAKVLQRLTKEGLLSSLQGVKGGYALSRKPGEIPLLEILNAIEGKPNVAVVQCEAENPETCSIHSTCTIRSPLVRIQDDINSIFQHMTVSQLVSS